MIWKWKSKGEGVRRQYKIELTESKGLIEITHPDEATDMRKTHVRGTLWGHVSRTLGGQDSFCLFVSNQAMSLKCVFSASPDRCLRRQRFVSACPVSSETAICLCLSRVFRDSDLSLFVPCLRGQRFVFVFRVFRDSDLSFCVFQDSLSLCVSFLSLATKLSFTCPTVSL